MCGWVPPPDSQPLARCATTPEDTPEAESDADVAGSSTLLSPAGNIDWKSSTTVASAPPPHMATQCGCQRPASPRPTSHEFAGDGSSAPYGGTWKSPTGDFTCESAKDGITCENQSGNGFFLNRDDYEGF